MEFLDEYDESRPRIIFQSRPKPSSISIDSSPNSLKNKPLLFISLTISLIFLGCSFIFLDSQFLNPLFLWLFLSFLVGPFAPISLTAGDFRVGQGRIVEFPPQIDSIDDDESKKKSFNKRIRGKRSELSEVNSNGSVDFVKISETSVISDKKIKKDEIFDIDNSINEKEWSDDELGLLKKQLVKYPIGKPRRWEVISEAFKGKHSVESVINKAKSLGKEKPDDSDSYSKFLRDRKPVVAVGGNEEVGGGGGGGGGGGEVVVWSSSEDIALLNALKVFPKEVGMRWEKIAAAVPGKSKAGCMKRVGELKKEFRSSKSNDG
ncbi:hypothetical protein RND81_13G018700 [Saponaria officinalis]|uniref:Myb-like domain-containing protein n=1 Tax=Saponaria officinalis TaxID=3572 RepID=A0AAW1H3C9_SAPOF